MYLSARVRLFRPSAAADDARVKRVAILALVLVACGEELGAPPDRDPVEVESDAGAAPPCTSDDDCPFGEVCTDGSCLPQGRRPTDDGCTADADCPDGMVCARSTGLCVPEPDFPPPPNTNTSTCTTGEVRRCGSKIGACEYGTESCVSGRWSGVCEGEVGPSPETCNDVDDDCDRETDEDFDVGGACTAGVGACEQSGVKLCLPDGTGTQCSVSGADPTGRTELCGNAIDDDCDNEVDEGFNVGAVCTAGQGACERSGVSVCTSDGLATECSAVPGPPGPQELCGNGIDDDCNGQMDETFPTLGNACTSGVGICERTGTVVCTVDQLSTRCSATPGLPAPQELCGNNLDDDCDMMVDEGFPNLGTSCSVGTPPCQTTGTWICAPGGTALECDLPPAGIELCNGMDDDNDTCVDEDFNVGQACSAGIGACARTGTYVCAASQTTTQCNAVPGMAGTELCGNGIDDDCDMQTDEGFTNLGTACTAGVGACERSGVYVCAANGLSTTCDAVPGMAGTELCGNNIDDDCDMLVDEGFGVGQPCSVGQGVCLRTGLLVCTTDGMGTQCNATPGTPGTEICNNLDDDCDNAIDEGCDDDMDGYCDATMTIVGTPAVCPLTVDAATEDCNDLNAAINPGATEICNDGVDQNCDGNPNDGCAPCNPAIDADLDGSNECDDCDDTNGAVRPGVPELCNGVDDDCDGLLDEGFDADMDNFTTCGTVPGGGLSPAFVDCDDMAPATYPGACELCALNNVNNTVACMATNDRGNLVDEDCDGYLDETCNPCSTADPDMDGVSECDGDCAPNNPAIAPGLPEICDGLDNDCNTATTENCVVGDPCNWPGTPPRDVCQAGLLCVESLGPGGQQTGNYTCTSFCNFSYLGLGVGDGCASNQACLSSLTPTANLHGCTVSTDIGLGAPGATCSADDQCRTANCLRDQRATGPPQRYCTDLCGSNAYCSGGTTCQAWGGGVARCWRTLTAQNRGIGVACNDTTVRCLGGPESCIEVATNNRICSQVCCRDADCPSGYHCSVNGNDTLSPIGGYDVVPMCWPNATGAHNRVAGQACTSSGQCASEFCDTALGVCVDLCCNDASCPTGLSCQQAVITRPDGHQTISRTCLNLSPTGALVARP